MAKITITIEDQEGQSNVKMNVAFDPEIKEGDVGTAAQQYAVLLLNSADGIIKTAEDPAREGQE
jgi:C4-type Zn-finger protein